jgi:hypothetical protein
LRSKVTSRQKQDDPISKLARAKRPPSRQEALGSNPSTGIKKKKKKKRNDKIGKRKSNFKKGSGKFQIHKQIIIFL